MCCAKCLYVLAYVVLRIIPSFIDEENEGKERLKKKENLLKVTYLPSLGGLFLTLTLLQEPWASLKKLGGRDTLRESPAYPSRKRGPAQGPGTRWYLKGGPCWCLLVLLTLLFPALVLLL